LDYASGDGPCPQELVQKSYIDAFGVMAIMGRPVLYAREIQHMIVLDNIVNAYRSCHGYRDSEGHENWPEWASQNSTLSRILIDAEEAAQNGS